MVIFFDIDGTIIDNETQIIPQSALRAVEALGRNGHIAVVNTGRPYSHIDPRIREMAFGGWVCGCGMEIRRSAVDLVCRACGAKLRIPAATDRDLDDLCCHMKLVIPGKRV